MKKINYSDISVRITFQGAYECSCISNGSYLHHQYMGYTKKESISKFYSDVNSGSIR